MFTDKIAIVTGAGRGIGKEIAKTLAAKGALEIGDRQLLRFRKTGRGDSAGDRSSRRKGRSPSV